MAVLLAAVEVHFDWATSIEINVSIVYGLPLPRLALPQCLIDCFELDVLIV
ncbi:hypothetical protein D8I24_2652 (plasmid) [Cupriavidus necator H850]|uniref:hypothetical protein n=1 Tax=Cupriavidus necator TaxID=106590 RepID=UPI003FA45BE8|nr:hypothetical protein D8I24_2652 [Cupriavidus necator H850]